MLAHVVVGATLAGSLLPVSAAVLGSAALAGTCSAGDVDLTTGITTKDIGFTHDFEIVTVPPHGSASWSLASTRAYTVGVTGEASATFKAGAILAEAPTTLKFTFHADMLQRHRQCHREQKVGHRRADTATPCATEVALLV
ncbi:MAG: hypothetical protein H0V73_05730 [Chloroflexi bacterium]|nr:hypothetical protein [Chloroflexota bacterium]